MKKYWIRNNLTGSHTYGTTLPEVLDAYEVIDRAWKLGRYDLRFETWKPEYILNEQQFYVLGENDWFINLENVKTGVNFWMTNMCITPIPVKDDE